MSKIISVLTVLILLSTFSLTACADEDFYGIVKKRPTGKVGTWVIGGRSIQATNRTKFDQEHGPIAVGSCVEVDIDHGIVEEIES